MELSLRWSDVASIRRFDDAVRALGNDESRKVLNRAINRTGEMARTKVVRALTKQTGLKRQVIVRAVKTKRSSWEGLTYVMETQGGDVGLRFFGARETRKGVSAAPFGGRKVFAGTFMQGGRFPNRKALGLGGKVFARVGKARTPFREEDSGVVIPAEMVKGATADAFTSTVSDVLPRRLAHEIARVTKGVVT
ncbi:hypothetical protein [Aureimonas phyllosphaerae]|uniref:Prophage minor tail protein Z (GPZ) n=1 Tax=Aureimonas phyllosphaerae TaxID=1166078 RepID=A0A7W6FW81_9HYPH|nr:hypothetical protein [Aureimonas phyllosphaerae]MBB3937921.1 hypothetical protein [Aureimonas phyllosphaerae]MBB3961906.1 hypothetical protein [Aureimonas phyllosphaerae]SFF54599.1 hypothetical protein SAMN05216566_12534 [Aureimonas phyllosphaerae]